MTRQPVLGALGGRAGHGLALMLAPTILLAGCATAADADAGSRADGVSAYDAALEPLRERSDVLERRFATVQQHSPDAAELAAALDDIVPAYADLLAKARAIEPAPEVRAAHAALIDSLESQQEGLELAQQAVEDGDPALMARAGRALNEAQALLDKHRHLLAEARRTAKAR